MLNYRKLRLIARAGALLKYLLILSLLAYIFLALLLLYYVIFLYRPAKEINPYLMPKGEVETANFRIIDERYPDKIGSNLVVLHKKSLKTYREFDKSCLVPNPIIEQYKNSLYIQSLFNRDIGLDFFGPYKSFYVEDYDNDIIYQSIHSGGRVVKEGTIKMYIDDGKLMCNIIVLNESETY